jgi:hypothetical protein
VPGKWISRDIAAIRVSRVGAGCIYNVCRTKSEE